LNSRATGPDGVKPEPVAVVEVPTGPWVTLRLKNGGPIAKDMEGAEFTSSETFTRYVPAASTGTGKEQLRSPNGFALVDPEEQWEIVVVPKVIVRAPPALNPTPVAATFDPTFPLVGLRERVGRLIV
jgi:hypothetical protein